ncbi:hypothetical protein BD779DRAFT_1675886 [Infundibulicybe gibba]|nr:hypothetical protein BD779DRAFT_1675886 [Infundibulicybe gibba]
MSAVHAHKHTASVTQNHKAQLANAYNELGKELSSTKIRVVGNYTLGKVIGEGAYGKVRMGTHRLTSSRVAIKQIPKGLSASLTREIHHHRQLHHPHVTQMYEVIATESSIWIVTELCCGGELFDYLVEKGRLGEDETRIIFGQLCLAVAYLHENNIVHRDLKLENVLLDERCRVKLGDFGFTREFERGAFMETFCGTTGYAAPEMLEKKKYQGPEVDVWSLGIILYCLLTGTLPFDDDDEFVMREKIIEGEFDDPEWLSRASAVSESRDLIKGILQKDVTKRLTIPQILAHAWFTSRDADLYNTPLEPIQPSSPEQPYPIPESHRSSETSTLSVASDDPFISDANISTPTTPNDSDDPFEDNTDHKVVHPIHKNPSETTLRKPFIHQTDIDTIGSKIGRPETVVEEDPEVRGRSRSRTPPRERANSSGSKPPPIHPVRTPARTKRRSVSSNLSDPSSPTADKSAFASQPQARDLDFASLLSTPSPIIFSTPLERDLLNTLSLLGFDTAQIVHSVLTDACDAAGAVWWMLKKKAEKKLLEDGEAAATTQPVPEPTVKKQHRNTGSRRHRMSVAVQTESGMVGMRSAPQLAFVPATPTFARPASPPRPVTPTRSPLLSPSSSTIAASSSRSHPSTPAASLKDRDGPKGRKARSGSVSIMQRATTALEAAGLVKKKSSEAVRDEKEKDREREREKSREAERERDRRMASGEEPRSSHGSGGSSRLTKSPPLKAAKAPATPPPLHHPQPQIGSPWVLTDSRDSIAQYPAAPTPANSPGDMRPSLSTPIISDTAATSKPGGAPRNRASLLTAFRLWFHEDRKGKRKEAATNTAGSTQHFGYGTGGRAHTNAGPPVFGSVSTGAKRRGSTSSAKMGSRTGGHRAQRPSVSSRRLATGPDEKVIREPHTQFGTGLFIAALVNSEFLDAATSQVAIRELRRLDTLRATSPMQKYHRRAGSGSSTRVVRQIQTPASRPPHMRSNSATSSIHSPPSSRPTSFYEYSENEGSRTASPYKMRSRRPADEYSRRMGGSSSTTFVAQKRQGPFVSPGNSYGNSFGRSSWKKSWGLEPPGWQSRTAHMPVEVLAILPAVESNSIRDVFSGRHSLSLGDESDWVDEDDEVSAFAGGLGQLGTSAASGDYAVARATGTSHDAKRAGRATTQKAGHSPVERASPVPPENAYETSETRAGRRQLPTGRSGHTFRHAIQEEDEEEDE